MTIQKYGKEHVLILQLKLLLLVYEKVMRTVNLLVPSLNLVKPIVSTASDSDGNFQ